MTRHTVWYVRPEERKIDMEKEELKALFCEKIGLEMGKFKRRILEKAPKELYDRANRIDCMVCIYEQLLELSLEMGTEELKRMVVVPDILSFLNCRWLKQKDSFSEELQWYLKREIREIKEKYNQVMQEEAA